MGLISVIFENNGFEDRIVIHFQPKNKMNILVKMVYLKGICMVEADSHFVWNLFNKEVPKGPAFVLVAVPQ